MAAVTAPLNSSAGSPLPPRSSIGVESTRNIGVGVRGPVEVTREIPELSRVTVVGPECDRVVPQPQTSGRSTAGTIGNFMPDGKHGLAPRAMVAVI